MNNMDIKSVNSIRVLAADAIQKANSGHPGLPLGAAPAAYELWAKHMKHNPANPNWENRDRFILSGGHGSALLYSLLHFFGYGITIDDMKNFRQLGSKTPGHPEYGHTVGVEATTGPLGAGMAMAVGMAMAENHLAATFNKEGYPVVDHYTYVLGGDGCMMEGISYEAFSLAGTLGLEKLIVLYDSNNISIEGDTNIAFREDVRKRFEAFGFHTQLVEDGNDLDAIGAAIEAAKNEKGRPSMIEIKTKIGAGCPAKEGKASAHGEPLGVENVAALRANLGIEDKGAFVIDQEKLLNNLLILKEIQNDTGCRILLAQKCFSTYSLYELMGKYLAGTTASGIYEAKLGSIMGKENHVFSPAYKDEDMDELLKICDHIVFNSFSQWIHFKEKCLKAKMSRPIEFGLRINPECSTQEGHAIYDPCSPFSRMGITNENFDRNNLEGISGLHFHTLCEQNSDDLATTLEAVEKQFGDVLEQMEWINFGGGHHITRDDYDIEQLIRCIKKMQDKYGLTVYVEPGEAVALNAGFMVSEILDIVHNGMDLAILDTSAACHMPDVLEMPYTPVALGAYYGEDKEKCHKYRFGGPTCLAGDVIGDYYFEEPLNVGDRVIFTDMAIYSMVKTNTFNGMKLPAIAYKDDEGIKIIKEFGYEDFKNRLS